MQYNAYDFDNNSLEILDDFITNPQKAQEQFTSILFTFSLYLESLLFYLIFLINWDDKMSAWASLVYTTS